MKKQAILVFAFLLCLSAFAGELSYIPFYFTAVTTNSTADVVTNGPIYGKVYAVVLEPSVASNVDITVSTVADTGLHISRSILAKADCSDETVFYPRAWAQTTTGTDTNWTQVMVPLVGDKVVVGLDENEATTNITMNAAVYLVIEK